MIMKNRSELKVGDKLIIEGNGAGTGAPLEITDIDKVYGIIGMGPYACSYNHVQFNHKFVEESGEFLYITADDKDIEAPLPAAAENAESIEVAHSKCVYCDLDNFNRKTFVGEKEVKALCLKEDNCTALYLAYDEDTNQYYLISVGDDIAAIQGDFCPKCGRMLINQKGDCTKCDWFSVGMKKCARPTSCKVFNEYFKDDNKDNLLKEGDFYYTNL